MEQRWTESVRVSTADPVSVVKCETLVRRILHEFGVFREKENRTEAGRWLWRFDES